MRKLPILMMILASVSCATVSKNQNNSSAFISLPRIGIRHLNENWEFYNKTSGNKFIPQGVNWVRLAQSKDKWPPNISFNTEFFSPHQKEIKESLSVMQQLGYNVVRVRIDALSIAGLKPNNLNKKYVENLISFIRMANQFKIYVLVTGQWMPNNYYQVAYDGKFPLPNKKTSKLNQLLMSEGLIQAFAKYESDLIRQIQVEAPELMSGIFAFDLWNELFFSSDELPFSETAGIFISETGQKYNLSQASSRQALADESTLRWVNNVATAIKVVDKEVLVTSSVFSPQEVQRAGYNGVFLKDSKHGDPRQPFRLKILESSQLDYIQIHPYPHDKNYRIESDLKSFEFSELKHSKPILVGEFGTYKNDFKTTEEVIPVLKSFLLQACHKGLAGWLYWTWDTYEQPYLWNMQESNLTISHCDTLLNYCVSVDRLRWLNDYCQMKLMVIIFFLVQLCGCASSAKNAQNSGGERFCFWGFSIIFSKCVGAINEPLIYSGGKFTSLNN